jgi:hypothetical protein
MNKICKQIHVPRNGLPDLRKYADVFFVYVIQQLCEEGFPHTKICTKFLLKFCPLLFSQCIVEKALVVHVPG